MFELNEKVKAYGLEGKVVDIADPEKKVTFPVKVKFSNLRCATFTLDGRYDVWHVEPDLKKMPE